MKMTILTLTTLTTFTLYPRKHRYLLHAIVQVKLGLNFHQVSLSMIDDAYSIAFPLSTPINVEKKKR